MCQASPDRGYRKRAPPFDAASIATLAADEAIERDVVAEYSENAFATLADADPGPIAPLTLEHVVPVSTGGADTLDNLVPACLSCNSAKGSKPLIHYLLYMQTAA